ncbi:MAG: cytosine permease [Conexivisphaerales archaeon]
MQNKSEDDSNVASSSLVKDITTLPKTLDRVSAVEFYEKTGQVELKIEFPQEGYLWNKDFHPIPKTLRNWGAWTYFSMWIGMTWLVTVWAIGGLGIEFGLNWSQSLILMFLGNLIVLIPLILQAHGGARYGLAESQLTRSRWGVYGAQIPSWLRAIISMGWWGIVTYIITEAATAIYVLSAGKLDALQGATPLSLASSFPSVFWPTFIILILVQLLLFYTSPPEKGQPVLKWLARLAAPFIIVGFLILFFSTMTKAGWNVNPVLTVPAKATGFDSVLAIVGFTNAMIAWWATAAFSMPDVTRFSTSQKAQVYGQIPMPLLFTMVGAMGLFSLGASMSLGLNGSAGITDPVILAAYVLPQGLNYFVLILIMLAMFIVNIYGNAIPAGYDIANSYSKHLSWFRGMVIGVLISAALGAWSFYSHGAYTFIYNWLLAYGTLLGAVQGIIIFDYVVIRRFKFELTDIFLTYGRFRYLGGFNPAAIISFLIGIGITYLSYWGVVINQITELIYANSYLSAFFISGIVYLILMVGWVIPRYQPFLKGSLRKGYYSDEVEKIFGVKEKSRSMQE